MRSTVLGVEVLWKVENLPSATATPTTVDARGPLNTWSAAREVPQWETANTLPGKG